MRIAVFGGSFNPVHRGHVAVCRYVAEHDLADRILVVPCLEHVFGKPLVSFEHRLAMCQLALGDLPRVELSTIEHDLGGVSATARTMRELQQRYPEAQFSLVVGEDIEAELPRWQEPDWIREHVDFIKIPRRPEGPLPDTSSTEIRARLEQGKSITDLVPPAVAEYIREHRLYV